MNEFVLNDYDEYEDLLEYYLNKGYTYQEARAITESILYGDLDIE